MNCSMVDITFLSEALSGERIWVILKIHYEKKLTKNIRSTDILQIYTSIQ